ncbi:MAG: polyprenyl synthetase family protein [PS1 clade bacterium]|nr:polyprenyl synthetase family protein [PS1 clade bacterium]CAI8331531.1 MAG: Octaprenyl diphosphate synthase [Rhodobiaceae bacterium UBA7378]HCQ81696.1 polyprenyl synthetase [Rhodobiaceae bacterium]|tara:strand:- start:3346 stop:4362 length:1017 start_codon:yes stop_codon:yes gene_type:complete
MATIININADQRSTDDALEELHDFFADDLVQVEATLSANLSSAASLIPEVSDHIIGAGGKRLRPLLTLSAAQLCGYQGTRHIMLAAAVEFMHTATLLHDDVVDDSDLRRGKPTARKIWGNPTSVLVGDFLLGQAFRMMVGAENLAALDVLSNAAAIIAEGEVMQLAAMRNADISEDNYLRIIDAKTAALFAAAAEVGGILAEASPTTIDALESYGRNLGIAFQLVDDALDYGSVNRVLGKNTGEDFREGKVTLPVVLAYRRGNENSRNFWKQAMQATDDNADFEQAVAYLRSTAALKDTVARATHYGEKAKDALALLPPSDTRTLLIRLADFCIARAY